MQIGNVVKWDGALWVISDCSEGVVGKDYTKRATLISLHYPNLSAYLTDKEGTDFHTSDAKVLGSNVINFVNNNLTKIIWRM